MAKSNIHDLTDKQVFFCREYMIDFNGTRAAIRAGYSEDSARQIADENLSKPDILEYIDELKKSRASIADITAEKILLELKKIGFSDIRDYVNEDYSLKDISEMKNIEAVKNIKIKNSKYGTDQEIELWDKLNALEKIAKHIGFFEKDNVQKQDNMVVYIPEEKKDPDTSLDGNT